MPTESRSLRARVPLIAALAVLSLALFAPQALARYVYTGNYDTDSVSVIDTATNQVVGNPIPAGNGPYSMAVTPNGQTLYVAGEISEDLTAINTQSNQAVGTIPLGIQPATIAISPNGSIAYVTDQDSDRFVVVDLLAGKVVGGPVGVGKDPWGVAFSPDGKTAYVTNQGDNSVSVIDTQTGQTLGTIPVGKGPINVIFSPSGTIAYVANYSGNSVSVINTQTRQTVGTIPVGEEPWGLGLNPSATRLYVSNEDANSVSVIDTQTGQAVVGPIPTGEEPYELASTPDGRTVYVANYSGDSVTAINTATNQTTTIPVPGGPWQIAIVPDQSPSGSFTATASKSNSLSLRFDAVNVLDPDGTVASFNWNYGDGVTAPNAGPSTVHKYAKAGTYAVGLSLVDNEGCSGFVFTGRTAFCNGANPTQQITVKAPNTFTFGSLTRNKSKGTAKLKVKVPYAGKISLFGKVKAAKRSTKKAGVVTLNIRPKPKTKKQLNAKGSAKIRIKVKFTPTGGKARTKGKTLKLIKR
ncbi:MAG: beta-propeller fold lactonase family protein [Solirubrobacterales bacterium]